MRILLPEPDTQTTVVLDRQLWLRDDEYFVVPPPGGESDYRNADVISQLKQWSWRDRRGRAFGYSVQVDGDNKCVYVYCKGVECPPARTCRVGASAPPPGFRPARSVAESGIFRGGDVQQVSGASEIAGEGPVEGFALDLTEIWEGL